MNDYRQQITLPGEDFRVADRMEILDLIWRFTMALDINDREMFEACFTDPMLWDLSNNPMPLTGGAADHGPSEFSRVDFVTRAFAHAESPSRSRFRQHCVTNPLITFTGDAEATVLAHLRNPSHDKSTDERGDPQAHDRMLAGLYHIDARRQDDRWRICALRLALYEYGPELTRGARQ